MCVTVSVDEFRTFYLVADGLMSWTASSQYCDVMFNGNLVTVDSQHVTEAITAFVETAFAIMS